MQKNQLQTQVLQEKDHMLLSVGKTSSQQLQEVASQLAQLAY